MSDDKIEFRGMQVLRSWPDKIRAAQDQTAYIIGGVDFVRVRYGDEDDDWGANLQPCHDCAVIKGEFHVPGCDVERCPSCGGQVIACDCVYQVEYDPNLN